MDVGSARMENAESTVRETIGRAELRAAKAAHRKPRDTDQLYELISRWDWLPAIPNPYEAPKESDGSTSEDRQDPIDPVLADVVARAKKEIGKFDDQIKRLRDDLHRMETCRQPVRGKFEWIPPFKQERGFYLFDDEPEWSYLDPTGKRAVIREGCHWKLARNIVADHGPLGISPNGRRIYATESRPAVEAIRYTFCELHDIESQGVLGVPLTGDYKLIEADGVVVAIEGTLSDGTFQRFVWASDMFVPESPPGAGSGTAP